MVWRRKRGGYLFLRFALPLACVVDHRAENHVALLMILCVRLLGQGDVGCGS